MKFEKSRIETPNPICFAPLWGVRGARKSEGENCTEMTNFTYLIAAARPPWGGNLGGAAPQLVAGVWGHRPPNMCRIRSEPIEKGVRCIIYIYIYILYARINFGSSLKLFPIAVACASSRSFPSTGAHNGRYHGDGGVDSASWRW